MRGRVGWIAWIAFVLGGGAYYASALVLERDQEVLLPGRTTDGHHQIEGDCRACHTADWSRLGEKGVSNDACLSCHAAELDEANDSHPLKKFRDPRNADRLAQINALECVTCHREHDEKSTVAMGVTQPEDYCAHCHAEIAEERPSHDGFAFQTCATAGCHNFHDNRALYERFLVKHAGEPELHPSPTVPRLTLGEDWRKKHPERVPLTADAHDGPRGPDIDAEIVRAWAETAHAAASVQCSDCHAPPPRDDPQARGAWTDRPGPATCGRCHSGEVEGFLMGKHGMRLARQLSPMTPDLARRPMKLEAAHRALSCTSCHGAHRFDRGHAAVDACLSCHDDGHSRAYVRSAHFAAWERERLGLAPEGHGVSCATCHMPRKRVGDAANARVIVEHNQSANLMPNEKMVRDACMACHGLSFALDAMADRQVIETSFSERPTRHVPSVDMAWRRHIEHREREDDQSKEGEP